MTLVFYCLHFKYVATDFKITSVFWRVDGASPVFFRSYFVEKHSLRILWTIISAWIFKSVSLLFLYCCHSLHGLQEFRFFSARFLSNNSILIPLYWLAFRACLVVLSQLSACFPFFLSGFYAVATTSLSVYALISPRHFSTRKRACRL